MIKFKSRRFAWRALVVAAGLLAGPSVGSAQDQPQAGVADLSRWAKFCNPDPAAGDEACIVIFQLYGTPTTVVAQVSLTFRSSDAAAIVLQLGIPTGVFVVEGLQLRIDEQEPGVIPFLLCDQQACVAEAQIDLAFVDRLKAGGRLVLSVLVPDPEEGRRQIDIDVTLVGFTAAFDGAGLSPEQAAAQQDALNAELEARAEAARQRLIEQQQQLNAN